MTESEVRQFLRESCNRAGGVRPWGRKNGVLPQQVSFIILGKRGLSDRVLKPLGIRKVIDYQFDGEDDGHRQVRIGAGDRPMPAA